MAEIHLANKITTSDYFQYNIKRGTNVVITTERSDYILKSIAARFEVLTAVTMKNDVFWDVTPCSSCKNRRFGGT
jgi:hypothetical protein